MTEIQDAKLVELVRKHPKLYNVRHHRHKHCNIREEAWLEIAAVLEQPVEACKARWKNIRDTFIRRETRRKPPAGSARQKRLRTWHLEKQLEFLKQILPSGKQTWAKSTRLDTPDDNIDNESQQIETVEMKGKPDYSDGSVDETFDETNVIDANTADNITESLCEQQIKEGKELRSTHKRKKNPIRKSVDTTVESPNQNLDDRPEDQHPIDIFFKSMAMSVKKLSIENQIRAKMQICQIVGELELDEARGSPSSSTS